MESCSIGVCSTGAVCDIRAEDWMIGVWVEGLPSGMRPILPDPATQARTVAMQRLSPSLFLPITTFFVVAVPLCQPSARVGHHGGWPLQNKCPQREMHHLGSGFDTLAAKD
jgi:hypothetical protein